jgi:hypothetical protein
LYGGAFDLIANPLHPERAITTIKLAFWQNKLQAMLALKDRMLEKIDEHLRVYPQSQPDARIQRHLQIAQDTLATYDRTIQQVERSIACLRKLVSTVEINTRARAVVRLDLSA